MKTVVSAISSTCNTRVKALRALQCRKTRDECRLYLVEGARLVAMALDAGMVVEELAFCPSLLTGFANTIVDRARQEDIPCLEVTEEVFASISKEHAYQGIAAAVHQRWTSLSAMQPANELCWIAVNAVKHPGNLGTMLRVSDAVGGAGVVLIDHTADPYAPVSVRASLGAIFTQRLVRADFNEFVRAAHGAGYRIVGTSPDGSVNYRSADYRAPIILLMGNERLGLTNEQQSACDGMVQIPMLGHVDSLNVAVASSIILYEALRQREVRAEE